MSVNAPGLVYLLEVAGQSLAQANHRIGELTEQNAELVRQVQEFQRLTAGSASPPVKKE